MAQTSSHDTLSLTSQIHQIDEVVVTGARHETDVRHLSQTVSVVGRTQIEHSLQPSLLPVLTEQVPGLFVTSRGVMEGQLYYGVNLFYINAKNLIQTLPNPHGSGMLNQNTGKIENTGVELQAAYRINRDWSVDGNYSYLHMAHPVIAAPEHKLYAGANFSQGRWNVSTGLQYIAGLYTQTAPAVTEDFVLWNVRASFRATRWLDIWARGENLLAQRYEINAEYPMPRATIMAGVNFNF